MGAWFLSVAAIESLVIGFGVVLSYLEESKGEDNLRAIQRMLLGISVMLLGGFFMVDPVNDLGGLELYILLIGFGITLSGFMSRSEK